MSQEDIESLRAFLRTWGEARHMEEVARGEGDMSLLDPDFTFESPVLPDQAGETYHGHDGLVRATIGWIEAYEWLQVELEQILDAGERIVSIHRVRAKARHTGIEFDTDVAYVWTFQDGKVIHCLACPNRKRALQAAGLEG